MEQAIDEHSIGGGDGHKLEMPGQAGMNEPTRRPSAADNSDQHDQQGSANQPETQQASHTVDAPGHSMLAACRRVTPGMPGQWLRAGWRDFTRAPRVSLLYGAVVVTVSWLVSLLAWRLGSYILLLAVLSGFIFVAPLMAVGLYSVSRHLAQQRRPLFRRTWREMVRALGQAMIHALVLLIIFLVWARAASMVHIFMPVEEGAGWGGLLMFLAVGSVVGSIFAGISFAASAFSLPMIADRQCDMITAVITSINAVLRNKLVMLVWALYIVLLTGLGLITAGLGLVIVVPWLAYATWHAYRACLVAEAWAEQPLLARPRH